MAETIFCRLANLEDQARRARLELAEDLTLRRYRLNLHLPRRGKVVEHPDIEIGEFIDGSAAKTVNGGKFRMTVLLVFLRFGMVFILMLITVAVLLLSLLMVGPVLMALVLAFRTRSSNI